MSLANATTLKFDEPRKFPAWAETLCVFLACLLHHVSLQSQLPVDDVAAYYVDLRDNKLVWDVGHLWAEPIGLFVYHHLQPHMGIIAGLEMLNVVSCAAAMAIFFRTLRMAGSSLLHGVLAVLLVAVSFDLVSLGPTAHIKLLVFPALALALHYAVAWELSIAPGTLARGTTKERRNPARLVAAAGAWLGIASTLLVSMLPMGPFIALLVFVVAYRQSRNLRQATTAAAIYLVAMGVCGLVSLLAAYSLALATDTTQQGNTCLRCGWRGGEGGRASGLLWLHRNAVPRHLQRRLQIRRPAGYRVTRACCDARLRHRSVAVLPAPGAQRRRGDYYIGITGQYPLVRSARGMVAQGFGAAVRLPARRDSVCRVLECERSGTLVPVHDAHCIAGSAQSPAPRHRVRAGDPDAVAGGQ